jgi:hypothetical protein
MSKRDEVVHQFESGRSWIRASIKSWRGFTWLDLRTYWEPEPGAELRPTKRGICVRSDDLDELEACLHAWQKALGPRRTYVADDDEVPF